MQGGLTLELRLVKVYELSTEDEGDYIFTPSGIVIVFENNRFTIYCQGARHNLLRAAISRLPWRELEEGTSFRGIGLRLNDITSEMAQQGWTNAASIPSILRHCYELNRRHLFFLERYLEA